MLGLRGVVDPRDRPRRRRRLRLQGHAAGRDAAGRAGGAAARAAGQVGRGPAGELPGRAAGPRAARRGRARAGRRRPRSSALRGRLLADLGAYLLPSTAIPPHTTAMLLTGCYDIPAVEVIVTGARTNKVPTAPYRGAGRPEATYLIETTIDAAARAARASTRSSCAGATSCARSRTGPRSAGRTTPATSSAASTRALELLGRAATRRAPSDERVRSSGTRRRRSCVERVGGGPVGERAARRARGATRRRRCVVARRLDADRPGPPDAVRADRRRPARDRRRAGDGAHRRHRRDRRRRRLLREPLDGDGRLGGRRRGRRPARPAGPATRASRPSRSSPRAPTSAVVEVERATGRCACGGWSRSTTPGGSSTRCSPRAR